MFNMYAGMKGFYRLRVIKAKSGTVKRDTGWFPNVITNRGLWLIYAQVGQAYGINNTASGCAVGTGSTPPTILDTDMESELAKVEGDITPNTSGYVAATANYPAYFYVRQYYTFGTGTAAGNISEIGVFPRNYFDSDIGITGNIFSRALILDENGNPTTITVLSDEILEVTYECREYVDASKNDISFDFEGNTITAKQYVRTSYSPGFLSRIPNNAESITLASDNGGGGSTPRYNFSRQSVVNDVTNSGTCWIDLAVTVGAGHATGTRKSIVVRTTFCSWIIDEMSTPLVKGPGKIWTLNFRYTWGRYTP